MQTAGCFRNERARHQHRRARASITEKMTMAKSGKIEITRRPTIRIELQDAIASAKAALVGESNDAEHQALADLVEALGQGEIPDCTCAWVGPNGHNNACPCKAWEEKSE